MPDNPDVAFPQICGDISYDGGGGGGGRLAVVEARRLVTTGCSSVSGAAYVIRTVTKLGHDFPFLF